MSERTYRSYVLLRDNKSERFHGREIAELFQNLYGGQIYYECGEGELTLIKDDPRDVKREENS